MTTRNSKKRGRARERDGKGEKVGYWDDLCCKWHWKALSKTIKHTLCFVFQLFFQPQWGGLKLNVNHLTKVLNKTIESKANTQRQTTNGAQEKWGTHGNGNEMMMKTQIWGVPFFFVCYFFPLFRELHSLWIFISLLQNKTRVYAGYALPWKRNDVSNVVIA